MPTTLARRIARTAATAAAVFTIAAQAQTVPGAPPGTPPTTPPGTPTSSTPTLEGSAVTVTQYYPDLASAVLSSTVTVSSSVEVSCPDSSLTLCGSTTGTADGLLDGEFIDIGATTISAQFLAAFLASDGSSFNGFAFTGLNFGAGFSGISGYTLSTNISGLTADRISFTADSLLINLLGLDPGNTTDGSGIGTFTISLSVSAVPEPAPLALGAAGLLALTWVARRRVAAKSQA